MQSSGAALPPSVLAGDTRVLRSDLMMPLEVYCIRRRSSAAQIKDSETRARSVLEREGTGGVCRWGAVGELS